MNQYHISKSFKPALCKATVRACPRGAHIDQASMDKVKSKLAETDEEKIFQNILHPAFKVHVLEATPEIEANKPNKDLTRDQLYMLQDYSGMDFYPINAYLRDKTVYKTTSLKNLNRQIDLLDSVFDVIKPTKPYVTYRGEVVKINEGESLHNAVTREFFPGSIVTKESYLSTSLNPAIAAHFAGKGKQPDAGRVILEIQAKSGVSMKEPSESKEEEMLLPRNGKYKVIGIRPYVSYQSIDYDEETDDLQELAENKQIMTVILEEI